MDNTVYILALGANIFFALGSMIYTQYSRSISSVWMNAFKVSLALFCFAITITILGEWSPLKASYLVPLLISGGIGLGIGDIFLLRAFTIIGPGRTMVLFGFQPLIIGLLSYFFLNQTLDSNKFLAIFFFIACLGTFSIENFKKFGHWDFKGILFALTGMTLDALGIILTRYSFNEHAQVSPWEGNFYRCLGAVIVFIIISKIKPFHFFEKLKQLPSKSKWAVTCGSLLGTFLSLGLYLKAIQVGHLASLSGMSITGTIFASLFESLYFKKPPSKYLIIAFGFFFIGMKFLLFS